MKTRRFVLTLAVVALAALLVPAIALGAASVHGNYADDTDACAGCHRAHTSYSTVTWTDTANNQQSALLVGDGTLWEMCYACHGPGAPGSTTDVEEGKLYDAPNGNAIDDLNGGAFDIIAPSGEWTSSHAITGSWGAYGGGTLQGIDATAGITGTGPQVVMDCTSCHDPHGSPNYRILSTKPGGFSLPDGGGYLGGAANPPIPDGYVASVETGFPTTPYVGFQPGVKYPAYEPNYTRAMYAKGYDADTGALNPAKGMSGWCAGCHTQYVSQNSTYAAGEWVAADNLMMRHRHPMNSELNAYKGTNAAMMYAAAPTLEASGVPLAHALAEKGAPAGQASDWIECLSCHRAHGTKATMAGAASEAGMATPKINNDPAELPSNPYVGSDVSALLRLNNRTACQACHLK